MAVTVVQRGTASEFTGAGTSATVSPFLPGVTTAGNTLLLVAQIYGKGGSSAAASHLTSVTDSQGNLYTVKNGSSVGAQTPTSSTNYYNNVDIAYATGIVGGTNPTITFNFSQNTFAFWTAFELTPSQFDQWVGTASTTATTTPSVGPLTPRANGAVLVAAFNEDGNGTDSWVVTAGWTLAYHGAAGGGTTANEYLAQTTAAAVTPSMTSAPGIGAAAVVSFTPGVAFVSSVTVGNDFGAATARQLLTALNTQTGYSIVVFVRHASGDTLTAITDTIGNTYTKITAASGANANGDTVDTWLCNSSTGANASNVIAVGNGSTDSFSFYGINALQFSGTAAVPLDVADVHATATTTAPSSNAISTTLANEVVVFALTTRGGSVTAANCAGLSAQLGTVINGECAAAYQIQRGIDSGVTAGFTTGSGNAVVATISLQGISAAPGVALTPAASAVAAAATSVTAPAQITPAAIAIAGASEALTAPAVLTAAAVAVGQATATVNTPATTPQPITPTAIAVAAASSSITAASRLTPVAQGVGSASLALTVPGVTFVTPTAQALAAAAAVVATPIPIALVAQAAGSATASTTAAGLLTFSATAISGAVASATSGGVGIAANATAVAQVTVVLRAPAQLSPSAQALAATSATFRVSQGLQANATAVGTAFCIVGLPGSMRPSARAVSAAVANVTAPPYTKVHLQLRTSMALTLVLGDTSAYDLQIRASSGRDETVSTV